MATSKNQSVPRSHFLILLKDQKYQRVVRDNADVRLESVQVLEEATLFPASKIEQVKAVAKEKGCTILAAELRGPIEVDMTSATGGTITGALWDLFDGVSSNSKPGGVKPMQLG